MRKIIYKFELANWGGITRHLQLNEGAELIKIAAQESTVCAWFIVDTTRRMVERQFEVIGTGQEIIEPDKKAYLGTAVTDNGFVWHVFEVGK